MRRILLTAATAFVVGGITAGSLLSYAQPAPPPGPDQHEMAGPGWHHPGPMRWMQHWAMWRAHHGPVAPGTFALVYPHADRNLTAANVQTIAQAFLLWHGNHTWKVVNVAPTASGAIGFALATQQGSVIANFTMDPHTGRVTRVD